LIKRFWEQAKLTKAQQAVTKSFLSFGNSLNEVNLKQMEALAEMVWTSTLVFVLAAGRARRVRLRQTTVSNRNPVKTAQGALLFWVAITALVP
jgi:hypothetical protein